MASSKVVKISDEYEPIAACPTCEGFAWEIVFDSYGEKTFEAIKAYQCCNCGYRVDIDCGVSIEIDGCQDD